MTGYPLKLRWRFLIFKMIVVSGNTSSRVLGVTWTGFRMGHFKIVTTGNILLGEAVLKIRARPLLSPRALFFCRPEPTFLSPRVQARGLPGDAVPNEVRGDAIPNEVRDASLLLGRTK